MNHFMLKYWLKNKKKWFFKRNKLMVKKLGIAEFKNISNVIDIGCGAYGGIFSAIKFSKMIGIDPLWDLYKEYIDLPKDILKVIGTFEKFNYTEKVDLIVCVDSINYCDNLVFAARQIISHLDVNGYFVLHLNLRNKKQLNKNHKYLYTEDNIINAFNKLYCLRFNIFTSDPINKKKYKTCIGIWRKI